MQNGSRNTKCAFTLETNGHKRNQSSNPPRVFRTDCHDRRKPIRKRKNGTLQSAQRQLGYIFLETSRHDRRSKISWNLEVYVDDLVIKSYTKHEILRDIEETFRNLRRINMKLNPKKCTFSAEEGAFLGHMVSMQGIKACPEKSMEKEPSLER
ncbi:reverse transcriptase domain-containing protein [Tanacetum coccineum]